LRIPPLDDYLSNMDYKALTTQHPRLVLRDLMRLETQCDVYNMGTRTLCSLGEQKLVSTPLAWLDFVAFEHYRLDSHQTNHLDHLTKEGMVLSWEREQQC
jgi:hypothetical protein